MNEPSKEIHPGRPLTPPQAILVAVPLALLTVAVMEICRIPLRHFTASPKNIAMAFFWSITVAHQCLWAPILFQLCTAAVHAARIEARAWRIASAALLFAASGAVSLHTHRILSGDRALASFAPLVLAFACLGIFLFAWSLTFFAPRFAGGRARLLAMAGHVILAAALVGGLVVGILNQELLRDSYPEVHLAGYVISYLLVHAGLARALVSVPRFPERLVRVRLILAGIAFLIFFLALPLCATRAAGAAKPILRRYTVLGRSAALLGNGPLGQDCDAGASNPAFGKEDKKGVRRFDKASNLPALPRGFSLDAYNILLVSMEATRYDETSLANKTKGTTPNMLAFAKAGSYWWPNAFSPSSTTSQVFSSIFSMAPPSMTFIELGAKAWLGRLRDPADTAAELLGKAGYRTFWAGYRFQFKGLEQGFQEVDLVDDPTNIPLADGAILDKAIAAIDRARASSRRFFGWVFFFSPHYPYSQRYADMPASSDRERYRQDLRYGDEQIGKLLQHLRKTGLMDRTVVIVHGDHGEEFQEHGHRFHVDLYEETIHVPLVVHIPGQKGRRVDGATSLAYLFPWLFERGSPALAAAGEDVLRRAVGPALRATDGAVVSERLDRHAMRSSLVLGRHQAIYDHASRSMELFDRAADPKERSDLSYEGGKDFRRFEQRMRNYLGARAALARFTLVKSAAKNRPAKANNPAK